MIMKKMLSLTLILLLLAGLTACTDKQPAPQETTPLTETTPTPEVTDAETEPEKAPEVQTEDVFSFTLNGIRLVPGAAFDKSAMPEESGKFEVPSCAIEGTDTVYNYGVIEVTVFDDGTTPLIYSIYLMDANTPTTEGLYMGDDVATAESIYGTDYTENGTEMVYERGNTELHLLTQNGYITTIELRMATK